MRDKLSKDFYREEFACKCGCGLDTVDAELLNVLQKLRSKTGRRISVISGHRCQKHNRAVGGVENSQHLLGRAADIVVHGLKPGDVYSILIEEYPKKYGIGVYPSFVHIDTRDDVSRWSKS